MIGLRVFYLDITFKIKMHPLAIRTVLPDPTDDRKITAEMVKKWAIQGLELFELKCLIKLNEFHIAPGVVTEGRTDVQEGVDQALNLECPSHICSIV